MSFARWNTVLVLGGIRSGRSRYAESQVAGADPVRRLTAADGGGVGRLAAHLAEARPDETLLVDGLDQWLAPGPRDPGGDAAAADAATLAAAVRSCGARLVLVSPEVGLSVTPTTAAGRRLTDTLGTLNQALADAVDAVCLVVAGQPTWLKLPAAPRGSAATTAGPAGTTVPDLANLKGLPLPDEDARQAAQEHLAGRDTAGFGQLERVVTFAAATQGRAVPTPWRGIRVLLLCGDHAGAASAGAAGSARRAAQAREGAGPVAQLAGQARANLRIVEAATAAPIEDGPAMSDDEVDQALAYGWGLVEQAADEGVDLLVLGSVGDGADTAAAAVTAVTAAAEPAALLGRVRTPDGLFDDPAWMRRCAAVRDAVHRIRATSRTGARRVLAELAGPDIATATGVLLGAAARRTPVLLDGPVGMAAALLGRDLANQARHWCLLPDHGGHPTVVRAGEVLGLTPLLDLRLELGEGAAALAALPLLRSALLLAGTLPAAPAPPAAEPPGA